MHPSSGGAESTRTRRPFHGWLLAVGVSAFGDRLSMLAIPWFVLTTTGSPVKTGLVAVAELTPMVVLKVLGGPAIDKLGPGRVAVACDLGSLVAVGAVPLLYVADVLTFPLLLALVALAGAMRGPADTAKDALVPAIVDAAQVPMERATGLENAVYRFAMTAGAAAAGALIVLVGPTNAIVVDALTFGASAVLIAWGAAALPRTGPAEAEEVEEASYLLRLREGWSFLRHDRLLLSIAAMLAVLNLLDVAFMTVLVPVWADQYAGPLVVGLVFAVWNLFSVVGSLMTAKWGHQWPRYPVFVVGFLLGGLPRYAVFAFDSPLWLVFPVAVVGGLSLGLAHPISSSVQFERIPRELTGRVLTLVSAMALALMPFSGLLGGGLVELVGLTATMLGLGAAYVLVVMVPALDPKWRELDSRMPADAADR